MAKATKKVTKKTTALKKATKPVGRPKSTVKKTTKVTAKVVAKPAKKKVSKAPAKKTIAKKVIAKKGAIKKTTRAKKPVSFIAEIQALVVKANKELNQRTIALQKQADKIDNKITKANKALKATEAALEAPATAKKIAKLQASLKDTLKLVEQLSSEATQIVAAQQTADNEQIVLNGFQATTTKKTTLTPAGNNTRGRPKKDFGSEATTPETTYRTNAPKEALEAVIA